MDKLIKIQSELKAPKNQFNKFGGYNYRNAEDILEALKPLLKENNCLLTISDSISVIGDKLFLEATATFSDGEKEKQVSGFAMHAITKKGMDESQITGAASSYARKYALNGLFLIDDTKDADSNEQQQDLKNRPKPTLTEAHPHFESAVKAIEGKTKKYKDVVSGLESIWIVPQKLKDELSKL